MSLSQPAQPFEGIFVKKKKKQSEFLQKFDEPSPERQAAVCAPHSASPVVLPLLQNNFPISSTLPFSHSSFRIPQPVPQQFFQNVPFPQQRQIFHNFEPPHYCNTFSQFPASTSTLTRLDYESFGCQTCDLAPSVCHTCGGLAVANLPPIPLTQNPQSCSNSAEEQTTFVRKSKKEKGKFKDLPEREESTPPKQLSDFVVQCLNSGPNSVETENEKQIVVDPRKYKTKLCRTWETTGSCSYGETCCFAHGLQQLRDVTNNHKLLAGIGYFSNAFLLALTNQQKPLLPPHCLYQQPTIYKVPQTANQLLTMSQALPTGTNFPFQAPLPVAFKSLRKQQQLRKSILNAKLDPLKKDCKILEQPANPEELNDATRELIE